MGNASLSEAIGLFLRQMAADGRAAVSIESYRRQLLPLAGALGDGPPKRITADRLNRLLTSPAMLARRNGVAKRTRIRLSNVVSLRRSDVDLRRHRLTLHRTKGGRTEQQPLDRVDLPEGKEFMITLLDVPTERDFEAFRRAAGGWKGTIDAEALIRDIYADRLISTRPEPRL